MDNREFIKNEYNTLLKKIKTTNYFKVDMHIHTPASRNDYKVNGKYYEEVSIDELKSILKEKLGKDELAPQFKNYSKDEIMAFLIVYEAFEIKKINMFIVTDHNNIDWYENIRNQMIFYTQHFEKNPSLLMVLPGVEITCFTGTHIIAIFDVNDYQEKFDYLKYELKANDTKKDELFTTRSEIDVIDRIYKLDGIVYIPHVDNNSSGDRIKDILDPISGLSKAQVLTNRKVHAIGFSNYTHRDTVEKVLTDVKHSYYREHPLSYLQDSDAHDINEIGEKYMYFKLENLSFNSLKFALEDPEIRIKENIDNNENRRHIIGLVTEGGFLSKKTGKKYYYPFAKDLNCIIGGRGTGKSTLINCIISCFLGTTPTGEFREFLSDFNNILIYFNNKNSDFCIECKPKKNADAYLEDNPEKRRSNFEQTKINNWITLYKKTRNGNFNKQNKTIENDILTGFFVDFFEQSKINEIGENSNNILELIKKVINNSDSKTEYEQILNEISITKSIIKSQILMKEKLSNYRQKLNNEINKLVYLYSKLDDKHNEVIEKLNINLKNKVKIILHRHNSIKQFAYSNLDQSNKLVLQREIDKNVTEEILTTLLKSKDTFELIELVDNKLLKYIDDYKISEIYREKGYEFTDTERENIYTSINNSLRYMINNIERQSDYFDLRVELNVNSFQESNSPANFKELYKLSYGQRAVAILSIITQGLAAYNIDYPLIIDQPEDHLDNTFIFNSLVKEIRELKEKRQIILVTHNANIPISGDAENIICLTSDGEKAWIDVNGPLDNERIGTKALNILEGGDKSFKRRRKKYKTLISI